MRLVAPRETVLQRRGLLGSTTRPLLWLTVAALLFGSLLLELPAAEEQPSRRNTALLLVIDDAIGPAIGGFFRQGLQHANEQRMQLLILQLDTPGGLATTMRDMIEVILGSQTPVVTYVAPSGARAASAGTYIMYASHVAAMAPATHLGAATPVAIGGSSSERKPSEDADSAPASAAERKAINDAAAYIRGLAELRNRNAEWAEAAVRSASSLSANAALEQGVVDLIAGDLRDLLRQIDGRTVRTATGPVALETSQLAIERFEADWRTKLLSWITNPNIAYFLLLAGIYGLLLEGYNPGAVLPGVVGAVSLVLALYALQLLSVNYAGLMLIALGVGLIIAESFAPSFGALGLGGTVAFVIGSIALLDNEVPGFQIARGLIIGCALSAALLMLLTAGFFVRVRRRPVTTGTEQLLYDIAVARHDFERTGLVDIHGETWQAIAEQPVKQGEHLRVLRVDGLTLYVAHSQ